jgi:hypothetical protein
VNALLVIKPEPGFPLSIEAEAIQLKNEAVASLKLITVIGGPETLQSSAALLSKAAGIVKRMEASRVEVKAPVLDLGKRIDKMASDFAAPIQAELDRVKRLVSDHHTKEAARIAEENRKREEAERKEREAAEKIRREEAAKAEAIYQAEQKAIREAAAAEQAKLAEEAKKAEQVAKAAAKKKDDGLRAMREAAAQQERERIEQLQEAARLESERQYKLATEERERVAAQQEAERIAEASKIIAPIVQAKAEGVSSRKHWTFEVLNPIKVYAVHPEFCEIEIHASVIREAIKAGMRECDGLRIYETVETKVRAL